MWRSSPGGGGAAAEAGVSERPEEAEDTRPGERSSCKDELEDDVGKTLRE